MRRPLAILAAALLAGMAACDRSSQPIRIDLLSLLSTADKRPPSKDINLFAVRDVDVDGGQMPAVTVPQPSRIVWTLRVPRRATLTARIGLLPGAAGGCNGEAAFRIGVSGGRLYEKVFERVLNPRDLATDRAVVPLSVDLSSYAGFQWSLFYHPGDTAWGLVFSVDRPASGCVPVWVQPTVSGYR